MDVQEVDDRVLPSDKRFRAQRYDPSIAASFSQAAMALQQVVHVKGVCEDAPVKSLRTMCIEAVASKIENVESLANIPWSIAREIYDTVQHHTPYTLTLFADSFRDEFAERNSHLVLRNCEIPDSLIGHLNDGWMGAFLRVLDLSGTNFGDHMRVVEKAWALVSDFSLESQSQSPNGAVLSADNDLRDAVVTEPAVQYNFVTPWFIPRNQEAASENPEAAIMDLIATEIHGRLNIVRTEVRRDFTLRKAVRDVRDGSHIAETSGSVFALSQMKKRCAERMEPAPRLVKRFKANSQRWQVEDILDLGTDNASPAAEGTKPVQRTGLLKVLSQT
ncbi:hypothetical protein HDU82_001493 [Entophlyctis luteolus]|nr:hypothetical protein HDU82_001493 [Entophlyctis luteolus]